jgi:hypothetical protein
MTLRIGRDTIRDTLDWFGDERNRIATNLLGLRRFACLFWAKSLLEFAILPSDVRRSGPPFIANAARRVA